MTMSSKTVGGWVFVVASAMLWSLAAYLAIRAKGSGNLHVYSLAVGFVALVLSAHAVLYILFAGRKERNRADLLRNGRRVEAEIVKIGRRGQRTAWRIKARHRDPRSGHETVFKSDLLRSNPEGEFRVGDRIAVYVDARHPSRYWVETGRASEHL